MPKYPKFDEDKRTFETRLLFIKELFTNKYEPSQIMASCISYKLDKSYEEYVQKIHKSCWTLGKEDPIKVLKRID